MTTYSFGSFQINANSGGLGYFLVGRELPLPVISPVTFNMARRDGVKKSGEAVGPRSITVTIVIVGSSKTDLISRLDTLQAALSLRGQQLCIHEDGRYYQNVDAISAPISFSAGTGVVQCTCAVAFTAYDPYAYSATPLTYDTGTVTLTSSSGLWVFPAITLTSVGSIYGFPLITLTNKSTASAWTSITITQTTDSLTLTGSATMSVPLPAVNGDYVVIQCDPSAVNGWSIQTNNSGNFTEPLGLFPVVQPGTTTFNISVASASGVVADALFSWVPRYMS